MKNVLMVGPVPPPYGGIAAVVQEIVDSELRNEYKFEVFDSQKDAPSELGLLKRLPFNIKRIFNFNKLITQKKFDFAHLHFDRSSFRGKIFIILSLRLRGIKVLMHLHGTSWESFYEDVSKAQRFTAKLGLKYSNIILVLYNLWVRNIKEILPDANVWVAANFVNDESSFSHHLVDEYRKKCGFSQDDIVVTFVGGLGRRKGCFDILEAVPLVVSKRPQVKFLFVGGDDYSGEFDGIKNTVESTDLSRNVFLTGEATREDVTVYLNMGQIFILPSYLEGAPIAIIEAMRASLPIITTPVGGIPDMIEHGVNGLLISPGKPEEIAESILRLVDDPFLRRSLGKTAHEVFRKRYSTSSAIREIARIYKKLENM